MPRKDKDINHYIFLVEDATVANSWQERLMALPLLCEKPHLLRMRSLYLDSDKVRYGYRLFVMVSTRPDVVRQKRKMRWG